MRGWLYAVFFAAMFAGCIFARYAGPALWAPVVSVTVCLCFMPFRKHRGMGTLLGFTVLFLLLGLMLMTLARYKAEGGLLPRLARSRTSVELAGKAVSDPRESYSGGSFLLEAKTARVRGRTFRVSERVMVRAEIDPELRTRIFPGKRMVIKVKLAMPGPDSTWLGNCGAACNALAGRRWLVGEGGSDWISSFVMTSRSWVSGRYRRLFSPDIAGFMEGVTLSRLDGMDAGQLTELQRCGLGHLVAVSGLNVAAAAALCLGLLSVIGMGRSARYVFAAVAALLVMAVAGFCPSAVRAALMALVAFGGAIAGRKYDSLAGISIAGIAILALNPLSAMDGGFRFSFAAAYAIILAFRGTGRSGGLKTLFLACAAAQLGVMPLLLLSGRSIPITALAANIVSVPLVGPILFIGWGSSVLSVASMPAARMASTVPAAMSRLILWISSFFSTVPGAYISGGVTSVLLMIGYVLVLAIIIRNVRNGRPLFAPLVGATMIVLVMMVPPGSLVRIEGSETLTALAVGEGDSILLRDGSGATVLVDGGPEKDQAADRLEMLGVRRLDLVVLTHPHRDHCAGLEGVLMRMPVGAVVDGGATVEENSSTARFLELVLASGARRVTAREGGTIAVSRRIELEFIYSPADLDSVPEEVNDQSVVTMARIGGGRVLLPGDIGEAGQKTLVAFHPDIRCDLMKVPHHGAADSVSEEMLNAAEPSVALICAGKGNEFGHPASECIELLRSRRITMLRTDREGEVEVRFRDGRIGLTASPGGAREEQRKNGGKSVGAEAGNERRRTEERVLPIRGRRASRRGGVAEIEGPLLTRGRYGLQR